MHHNSKPDWLAMALLFAVNILLIVLFQGGV